MSSQRMGRSIFISKSRSRFGEAMLYCSLAFEPFRDSAWYCQTRRLWSRRDLVGWPGFLHLCRNHQAFYRSSTSACASTLLRLSSTPAPSETRNLKERQQRILCCANVPSERLLFSSRRSIFRARCRARKRNTQRFFTRQSSQLLGNCFATWKSASRTLSAL